MSGDGLADRAQWIDVLAIFFQAGGLIGRFAIQRQYIAVAPHSNRGALAGPEPGGINQVSRSDRFGFEETLCTVVADASELDNKSQLEPRKR